MRFWRRALVCRQAVALMDAYLDATLARRERRRLEEHLAACPHCTEYLAQLRITVDALGHADPEQLPDEAVEELAALYRSWVAS